MKTQAITMDVIGSVYCVIKGSFLMNIVENPTPSGFNVSQDNRGHMIIICRSSGVGCQIAFFVLWLSLFALLFLALTIRGEIDPIGFMAHGSWKEWLSDLPGFVSPFFVKAWIQFYWIQ